MYKRISYHSGRVARRNGSGAAALLAALIAGIALGALLFCPAREKAPSAVPKALSFVPPYKGAEETEAPLYEEAAPEMLTVELASPLITVSVDGEPVEMELEDYVLGVVAGEMPASSAPAALEAQAVAARTFAALHMAGRARCKSGCTVCGDPSCCQAYLSLEQMRQRWGDSFESNYAKLRAAAENTRGLVCVYDGQLINAFYHASSGPATESSEEVFACALPYLVSVESCEGEHEVVTRQEFSEREVVELINAAYPEANMSLPMGEGDLDIWGRSASGRVQLIRIGETVIPGSDLRRVLGLKSTAFEVEREGGVVAFTCLGYGHGVGMSQTGANEMAKKGAAAGEILAHYYTGTELARLTFKDG